MSLAIDQISQVYTWADDPVNAVIVRNRDLRKLGCFGGRELASAGLTIFQHGQRPCLFATIAGIIVGVTEKSRRWDYSIDDGTEIVDVCIQARKIPAKVAVERTPASVAPSSSARTLTVIEPSLQVGDLVQCTGKIWRKWHPKSPNAYGGPAGLDVCEATILNADPTAEALHNLSAHRLMRDFYSKPFDEEKVDTELEVAPLHQPFPGLAGVYEAPRVESEGFRSHDLRLRDKFSNDLKRLSQSHGEASRESSPFCSRRMRRRNEYRRTPLGESSQSSNASSIKREAEDDSEADSDDRPVKRRPQESILRNASTVPTPPSIDAAPKRQLRTPSKLKDAHCTQYLFRVYVQKFLLDWCDVQDVRSTSRNAPALCVDGTSGHPPPFTLAFLQRVRVLRELAVRVVDVLLQSRSQKSRRPGDDSSEDKAHKIRRLFEWVIRQLVQDGFLCIASRVQEPQWPYNGLDSDEHLVSRHLSDAPLLRRPSLGPRSSFSRSTTSSKLHRSLLSQLDLPPPASPRKSQRQRAARWAQDSMRLMSDDDDDGDDDDDNVDVSNDAEESEGDVTIQRISTAAHPRCHNEAGGAAECYQVVTPRSLLPFLVPLITRSNGTSNGIGNGNGHRNRVDTSRGGVINGDFEAILSQLKRSDERFEFVTADTVRDSMALWVDTAT